MQQKGSAAKKEQRGKYLVTAGGCADCHSPKIFTPRGPVPDSSLPEIDRSVICPNKWGGLFSNDLTA